MMDLLALLFGLALPGLLCWLALLLLEGRSLVLTRAERIVWALTLGPTLFTFFACISQILGLTKFTLLGFLLPNIVIIVLLAIIAVRSNSWRPALANSPITPNIQHNPWPKWASIALVLLGIWTAVKLIAGAVDLVTVPTYWDDSFNNWNMRGKLFYYTQELTLTIPIGNGTLQTMEGVSSYPPSLPLVKTWLSDLRGTWSEPLINGVHLLWLFGLLASFFLLLRRSFGKQLSLLGTYLLASLPLLLIQGMNPYGDVFLASHLFLVIACLLGAARAGDEESLSSWLKLFGFTFGLLLFTKNEAVVIYAPLLVLLFIWLLAEKRRTGQLSREHLGRLVGITALIAACLILPWFLFKWLHGLTFGNAKSVTGMMLSFNPLVIEAIWTHLTHEPNWLFLPLFLPLTLLAAGKRAFRFPESLLATFVLVALLGQFTIFTFATSLATEAIMQTGLSRGILQVVPVALLLVLLLVRQLFVESEENQE
jgi:hypothetical protein